MPWARLDDRYDDSRKIKRALRREPAAIALHVMAITYCNRHNTDGEIEADRVEEWLALMPYRAVTKQNLLAALFELRLFERKDDDTLLVHDYLDWNRSSAERAALAEQGRRGGLAKAQANGKPSPDGGSSPGLATAKPSLSKGSSTPRHATPTPRHATPDNSTALRAAVAECFAYWRERCGHSQAEPSPDRTSKIAARLKERARFHNGDLSAAVQDVRRAIDGAALAAYVDDRGKRHDGIPLICRNNDKLEDFMGRANPSLLRVVEGGQERSGALRRADAWRSGYEEGA